MIRAVGFWNLWRITVAEEEDSMKEINQWWDESMPDNDEVRAKPCNFEEAEKLSTEDNTTDVNRRYNCRP
ncbi:hypothetical protein D5086_021399 [Populus alba]|uniref:Uncharacterized protein n=2 Tax=Populus TaxID=3689 RepID=A0ACC4BCM5_POPAL|nr:hypothetical protein NC653_027157 [Populus alba x Populus x berolinensis]